MHVKLLRMQVEPSRTEVAAGLLRHELAPALLEQPGAVRGCWMANETTGTMLSITYWTDRKALEDARGPLGALRADLLETLGVRLFGSKTYTHQDGEAPGLRTGSRGGCSRVLWTESLPSRPPLRQDTLIRAARTLPGCPEGEVVCCGLADDRTGHGVGIVGWGMGPAAVVRPLARRDRRNVERALGCRVTAMQDFETVVSVATTPDLVLDVAAMEPRPARA